MEFQKTINTIICGDCEKVMEQMPDEVIDLTVTSPPYGVLRDYKGYIFDFKKVAQQLYRITKPGGVVVWVVGDTVIDGGESGTSFEQALYFKEIGFNLYDTMIYEKNGSQYPEKKRYYQCFEYMFVLSKGKPKTVHLLRDRVNKWEGSWGKRSRRQKDGTLTQGDKVPYQTHGVRFNIWRYNTGHGFSSKDKDVFKHSACFPEKLAEDHIVSWSDIGDLILDPMCGSGTTLKMAIKNKRNYIGIDISKEYCELTEKRIKSVQQVLFDRNDQTGV